MSFPCEGRLRRAGCGGAGSGSVAIDGNVGERNLLPRTAPIELFSCINLLCFENVDIGRTEASKCHHLSKRLNARIRLVISSLSSATIASLPPTLGTVDPPKSPHPSPPPRARRARPCAHAGCPTDSRRQLRRAAAAVGSHPAGKRRFCTHRRRCHLRVGCAPRHVVFAGPACPAAPAAPTERGGWRRRRPGLRRAAGGHDSIGAHRHYGGYRDAWGGQNNRNGRNAPRLAEQARFAGTCIRVYCSDCGGSGGAERRLGSGRPRRRGCGGALRGRPAP